METCSLNGLSSEWNALSEELHLLESEYKNYQNAVNESINYRKKCMQQINHQKYRMSQIEEALKRCKVNSDEDKANVSNLLKAIKERKNYLHETEDTISQSKGRYLRIILGGINTKILTKEDKLKYKEQYERFKIIVTGVILVVSLLDLVFSYRAIDAILHFLMVWYHCTLTIRESILIANGSRIKGWWRTLQFITTVKAGIMIVWPDGLMYDLFRTQFVLYIVYTSLLQFLQFYYQQGCLYRLRALGERYDMDVTLSGFHSWMWKGLSFLIPFLYIGYAFQLYNAVTLYKLSFHEKCVEWQVLVVAIIFFALFLGNTITTSLVIRQKLKARRKDKNE
ncbi:transmembrane protein 120A-like protein [Dinothrombium tinctorium]|uniref:Transmembrane protein 120A-like protein n=1 Tax=Dinothrombium tinctorium TaxID=1965070 RepID=A0A3S3RKK0_9ACAR|nr:transmembrane protein 120A-like protein [Dinothrombium tinctorium]RWS02379.1 transmembrane protein 120A-like protein [Dinothrombium tinctorium]RWS17520.1 transmembrane protein 120A-like protein [Dinothrombium tinctorium]